MHISHPLIIMCGSDSGTLSEIHTKTDQHCRAEDCFVVDMK